MREPLAKCRLYQLLYFSPSSIPTIIKPFDSLGRTMGWILMLGQVSLRHTKRLDGVKETATPSYLLFIFSLDEIASKGGIHLFHPPMKQENRRRCWIRERSCWWRDCILFELLLSFYSNYIFDVVLFSLLYF